MGRRFTRISTNEVLRSSASPSLIFPVVTPQSPNGGASCQCHGACPIKHSGTGEESLWGGAQGPFGPIEHLPHRETAEPLRQSLGTLVRPLGSPRGGPLGPSWAPSGEGKSHGTCVMSMGRPLCPVPWRPLG